ncbi:ecotropic viral integration site 5 ortholog-like isoform X1 [Limulus polyphemus]|uniref:Ecotropic viral integration site 5 ortholog-like isoform X1 n=1 Tax=Limulus polyphemus TaxID=6850 RepID=A0ABM1BWV2_LIMPO|nr:ecotropic viral integration site 5 ortholog-like isoform X1 [Limulus polyphemus]
MSELCVPIATESSASSVPCTPVKTILNGELKNDKRQACSKEDLQLLARLEEQNRLLESDSKSLNSLVQSHSRKSSDTSMVSAQSSQSHHSAPLEDEQVEDVWLIWGKIVNDWDNHMKKKNQYVRELVRKGIPHHFRGVVWQLLCNAQNSPSKEHYAEYIKSSSPCEKVIRRDIARTYPEHEFFREKDGPGQEGLFNVMKAYSLHDREVGYCQGSAFIVGLLQLQMPEEEAFAVLTRLMEDYRLREMYKPSMAELGLCMYQLESIVQEQIPELHIHFQSQSFHTSMYASSWFLTLFTAALPLQLALRVMDLFLSEGMEMVFRIAVAILQFCKEDLLQLDMEGMLRYFQKEMPSKCETDPDYLVSIALQVKYNSKKMKKLEKDYTTLKVKEHEELIEMRRLRTENRLLRQRIENLEQESSSLADRLIQDQISRAQKAEENFAIKRELAELRDKEQAVKEELELAYEQIKTLSETGSQSSSTDNSIDDLLQSLQEELVAVKLREAEKDEVMQDFRGRIQELEEANKQLREITPDKTLAQLQEELIAVKLREAEANLSMKELKQKVLGLQTVWRQHLNESSVDSPSPSKKQEKSVIVQLQEDLISAKLREADAVAELKELRQKVMELEAQNQVNLNQSRRQTEELEKLQKTLDETVEREKELQNQLKDEERKYGNLESKVKEEQMMAKIKEVEHTQVIAELRQKISSLEIKNQELMTVGQLRLRPGAVNNVDSKDLRERVADLKTEIIRLEALNKKLTSAVAIQALQSPSSPTSSLSKDSSLTNLSCLLELAMSRSNSFCDESLCELLQLGVDQGQLTTKDLLNKNTKVNGEGS